MVACVPEGREVLRLNLDETACRLYYKPRKGDLADRSVAAAQRERSLVQDVASGAQKAALSHMGLVCDAPALQPHMPQFILGNEHVLSKALLDNVAAALPTNVHLLRRKSSWVNHESMAEWGCALSKALAPHRARYQPILLLDACPTHYGDKLLRELAKGGIWVVFVPAGLTWLMQVCDTHVFAKYKAFLRDRQQSRLLSSGCRREVSTADALADIVQGIRRVLQGTAWAAAFDGNGYGGRQRCVRARILRELECAHFLDVPETLPTLSQIESISPANVRLIFLYSSMHCLPHAPHPAPWLSLSPPLPRPLLWKQRRVQCRHGLGGSEAVADSVSVPQTLKLPRHPCLRLFSRRRRRHVCQRLRPPTRQTNLGNAFYGSRIRRRVRQPGRRQPGPLCRDTRSRWPSHRRPSER